VLGSTGASARGVQSPDYTLLPPSNSLKPTRRARGQGIARCPQVWAIEVSACPFRRVGVRLVLFAREG
jgi:hypothetical protein